MKKRSASSWVKFSGWTKINSHGARQWESWIRNLSPLHQSTWKKAGIFEAIMGTMYPIKRYTELVFDLASRWCSNTNTFVFPWGEATLTLEDMLVLGGFSALGVSAFNSVDAESFEIESRLDSARKDIQWRDSKLVVLHFRWMNEFKGSGSELEHVAFLSMWLSRFIFTRSNDIINRDLFGLAVRLSKGTKIALGPAVLAMLYRDLTVLQNSLCHAQPARINLCAPLYLVQIWAWERFPVLKPVPNHSDENFPRTARWSNLKIWREIDLRSAIDSAGESFLWCPYECEGRDTGRCVKTVQLTQLVGIDGCVERYHPRRVARQFGFDQDTPRDNIGKASDLNPSADCGPMGFLNVVGSNSSDSDSDSDSGSGSDYECGLMVKKYAETHVPETRSGKLYSCSAPSPDLVIRESKSDENLKTICREEHQDLDSPHSHHESIEAVDLVKISVNELGEDKGEVGETKHDEKEERSTCYAQNEVAMRFDGESYPYETFEDIDFDLEARIQSLENVVFARRKHLQQAKLASITNN